MWLGPAAASFSCYYIELKNNNPKSESSKYQHELSTGYVQPRSGLRGWGRCCSALGTDVLTEPGTPFCSLGGITRLCCPSGSGLLIPTLSLCWENERECGERWWRDAEPSTARGGGGCPVSAHASPVPSQLRTPQGRTSPDEKSRYECLTDLP